MGGELWIFSVQKPMLSSFFSLALGPCLTACKTLREPCLSRAARSPPVGSGRGGGSDFIPGCGVGGVGWALRVSAHLPRSLGGRPPRRRPPEHGRFG